MLEFNEKMCGGEPGQRNITLMLQEWSDGNDEVLNDLIPIIHEHLRRQARNYLHRERRNHTFETVDLINEAYLKISETEGRKWKNRSHFFAVASQAMRRILVDYARARRRQKRGGDALRIEADIENVASFTPNPVDLIALDEALSALSSRDPRLVRIVELHFFGGLTLDETAKAIGVSRATVAREWSLAKAWLSRELEAP